MGFKFKKKKKVVRAEININLTGGLPLQSYASSLRLPTCSKSQQDSLVLPFEAGMCRSLPVACKFSQLTNLAPGFKLAEGGWGESSVRCPRGYRKRVSGQDTWHKPHAMQLAPLPYQAILAWWLAVTVPPSAALWTTCRPGETQPGLALPFCFPLPSRPDLGCQDL